MLRKPDIHGLMGHGGRIWWAGLMVAAACGGNSKSNPSGSAGGANTGGAAQVSTAGSHPMGGASSVGGAGSGNAGTLSSGGGTAGTTANSEGGMVGEGGAIVEAGTAGDGAAGGSAGEAGTAGEGGTAGDANLPPEIACSCAAGEACVRVRVTRATDTSRQPWVVWPTQADGAGTLRVSAVDSSYKFQDKASLPNVSFVAETASYGVPLCVPAGATQIRAFLDDNEDEDPNAVTSSDYLDSCSKGSAQCFRCNNLNVAASAKVDLSIELTNSCD